MVNVAVGTVPRSFWGISVAGLVWTLIGVMTYIMTVTVSPEALGDLPKPEQALLETLPAFIVSAYATAVFSGVLGCLALLLRKRWATPLFVLSLIAIVIQMTHTLLMSAHLQVYGPTGAIVPVLVILVAAYLVWFSRSANKKGWLS